MEDLSTITDMKVQWDDVDTNYYVYAHYKKGTEDLFYIGIAKYRIGDTIGRKYLRAYQCSKLQRNYLWLRVYNKYGRDVKILYDNLTEKQAKQKEIELIAKYGTIIKGTGTLCNISGGGEGRFQDTSMCKKIFVYDLQGRLINKFDSCNEAAYFYHLDRRNIGDAANMKRKTCGDLQFRYEYNKGKNLLHIENTLRKVAISIVCTNRITGEQLKFPSIYKFCQYIGIRKNTHVLEVLNGKRAHVKNWIIQYDI